MSLTLPRISGCSGKFRIASVCRSASWAWAGVTNILIRRGPFVWAIETTSAPVRTVAPTSAATLRIRPPTGATRDETWFWESATVPMTCEAWTSSSTFTFMTCTVPEAGLGTVAMAPFTSATAGPFTVTPTSVVTAQTMTPRMSTRQDASPIQARVRVTTMASSNRSPPDSRGGVGASVSCTGPAGTAQRLLTLARRCASFPRARS